MTQKDRTRKSAPKAQSREDRLKAALKANLARRKAQARVRDDTNQDGSSKSDA